MVKQLRAPMSMVVQSAKSENWQPKPYIQIEVLPATTRAKIAQPERLALRATDDKTPYSKDTPLALFKRLQELSAEHNLPADMWAVKTPPQGEARLEQPVVRYNYGQPYLSFFLGRAQTEKEAVAKPARRVFI